MFGVIAAGRRAFIAVGIVLVVATLAVEFYKPLKGRFGRWVDAAQSGRVDDLLANRGAEILAAWEMAKDRPLLGVGPGCYAIEFYRYKLVVEAVYPSLATAAVRPFNFGAAHCDHLQTMAQTGMPGYVLLLVAMGALAWRSFGPAQAGVERKFARAAALPLAVAFAVSALPQFPMELAGTMIRSLAMVVLCTGRVEEPALA